MNRRDDESRRREVSTRTTALPQRDRLIAQ
jgi:hypothetical protein